MMLSIAIIREMQIKATRRDRLTPLGWFFFFFLKTQKIVSVGEDVQIWNLYVLLWEYKMMQSLWKAVRQVLKN